ncbi:hypothetical protein [Massilia genomosp. 1]|uniref:Uncharacterized protein n=1 Tax=Massilia genomosp. 1 TaxID=2609280 RepID=A0ABX0N0K0_9BURK|nr:hypothetical protein [Massilia genomosp. 1]NHZ65868.1 hypothetical protein [Massilia genomosp. 1]
MSITYRGVQKVFQNEIDPLWGRIEQLLKEHDICAIAAFVIPLTPNTGTVVLYATPNKDGTMPASLMAAYKSIDPTAVITPLASDDTLA